MPRLTPEQDAALQAELELEMPKVNKAVDAMNRELAKLSDIGQIKAVAEVTLEFIARHASGDEEVAHALAKHLHEQIDGTITMAFSSGPPRH